MRDVRYLWENTGVNLCVIIILKWILKKYVIKFLNQAIVFLLFKDDFAP